MTHHRPFELAVRVGNADHILGSEPARVTVAEYGDFGLQTLEQGIEAALRP